MKHIYLTHSSGPGASAFHYLCGGGYFYGYVHRVEMWVDLPLLCGYDLDIKPYLIKATTTTDEGVLDSRITCPTCISKYQGK